MVDLPRRFVPTSSRFVSPVRIVVQSGHEAGITAVAFSPCARYFASADLSGCVKIWVLETLDILGSYIVGFVCQSLEWEGLNAVICRDETHERRLEFIQDDEEPKAIDPASRIPDASRVIRLIGAPEAVMSEDKLTITYNETSWSHEIKGLSRIALEPCERYVVALSPQRFVIASAYEETLMVDLPCPDYPDKAWMNFHISSRGDFCTFVGRDGSIWTANPMKKTSACLFMGLVNATACDFGGDNLVVYGDDRGVVTVYDVSRRMLLLRTPRKAKGFQAIYPSPDSLGLVALRPESATAFLGYSKEILSAAPLPAALLASCPGRAFSEVYAACDDSTIYRLCLDSNTITKCCVVKDDAQVTHIASGENIILIRLASGTYLTYQNGNISPFTVIQSKEIPVCMAISDDSKTFAVLFDHTVEFGSLSDDASTQTVDVGDVVQIAFGKDKSSSQIFLFRRDLSIHTLDTKDCTITSLQTLPLNNARIISTAPAAKSFLFVLLETEHGQLAIIRVGLNTGKASLVLRVFVHGTQIWAASTNEETVNLRNDASCLRIISGLKAYLIEDWVRSEPLSIF